METSEKLSIRARYGDGRQYGYELSDIKANHVERYRWAASLMSPGSSVVDLCSGAGYGAHVLAEAGHSVLAIEASDGALEFARNHWSHKRIQYRRGEAHDSGLVPDSFNVVTAFECIEHLACPELALTQIHKAGRTLFASVPNEDVVHHDPLGNPFHVRGYRESEFLDLVESCGFVVDILQWYDIPGVHNGTRSKRGIVIMAVGSPQRPDPVDIGVALQRYFDLLLERCQIIVDLRKKP